MSKKLIRNMAFVALAGAALAACGGDDSPTPVAVVTPPPPAPKLEDGFGTGFGLAYRADPNTEAKDPVASDIAPLSLTTEPTTI